MAVVVPGEALEKLVERWEDRLRSLRLDCRDHVPSAGAVAVGVRQCLAELAAVLDAAGVEVKR